MSTILEQLNPLYTDICNLLGELAGNEAYFATLEANFNTSGHPNQPPDSRMFWAEFTVPGSHGFTMEHPYWGDDFASDKPNMVPPIEVEKALRSTADQAWHSAYQEYSSSAGWDAILRGWGQNVWEPDVQTMSISVDGLVSVAQWLHDQLKPDAGWVSPDDPAAPPWLAHLRKYWPTTSESSSSFFAFWNDVNDKCALYLDAAQRLAATSAQVTATVNDFQKNLLEVTQKTRDHVELALKQWQDWKGPSGYWPNGQYDSEEGVKTILGGVSYAAGVIALIPPAAVVSGTISVVTGGLAYLVPDKVAVMVATKASTAIDIWTGYYSDVDSVCTKMKEALDGVHTKPQDSALASGSQGFQDYVAMVKSDRRDWEPPAVNL